MADRKSINHVLGADAQAFQATGKVRQSIIMTMAQGTLFIPTIILSILSELY